jgi:hypothetical protein
MEASLDEINGDALFDEEIHDKEENINIRRALEWKRRHFLISCLIVAIILVLKMEYSYTKIFQNNI